MHRIPAGGRRTLRLAFDRLEARRLLATSPPVAEFPLRQFGGTPEGITQDASGNTWVMLAPDSIAELGGNNVEYQVPSYDALGTGITGSELGLITYNPTDKGIWFYETNANKLAMLNPATGAIAEYPLLPFASDPGIYQIVAGPDGNIYFTEPSLNAVGMFDITTDQISQFEMPLADTQPQGITVGGDGNIWFTDGGQNKITSLNPVSHVINNYAFEPPSHITNDQAEGITAGPNDTLWFVTTQNSVIQEFSIANENSADPFTEDGPYWPPAPPNPNPPTPFNADLWSIETGSDGGIYYTEGGFGWIGYINSSNYGGTGRFYYPNEFQGTGSEASLDHALIDTAPPGTGSNLLTLAPAAGVVYNPLTYTSNNQYAPVPLPAVITTTDANDIVSVNNNLYFSDSLDGVGMIGEFDPYTQIYSVYQVPQLPPSPVPPAPARNQYPNQMTVDSSGNIWFTETNANIPGDPTTGAIGEFDPTTGGFTQSYLTAASTDPVGIAWDASEQQFFMTEPNSNEIVSYNPATTGSAVAPILSPPGAVITDPAGILVDNNTGFLWIAEQSAKKIVAYSPFNESILFSFSTKGNPNQLYWGPDGNIWFTETGYVGVLTPATAPGTGGIVTEIPVSAGTPNYIAAGPTSGPYADTMWFTVTGSTQIGEISTTNDTLTGYTSDPGTTADPYSIAIGPDGNMWFTSGTGNPPVVGAVVLNPADLGTQVVVTTEPLNTEETVFGGYSYSFGFAVAVENSAGQVDPFVQQGTITIALNDPSGSNGTLVGPNETLPPLTLPVSDGLALFDGLTVDAPFTGTNHAPGAGYTFTATYSLGLNAPTTAPFDVTGPATQLAVTTEPPSSVGAGVPFGVTVSAEDANGLVVPTFVDPIQLTITSNPPGNGVLNGTNPLGAFYGSATFADLSIDQAGVGYVLEAVDPNAGTTLTTTTTAAFTITAGPATHLVFAANGEPPPTATAGQNLGAPNPLVVYAEDKFGYTDLTFDGPVTIALANGATGRIAGTLTVDAVNGVATFNDVAIDSVGTYNLQATSGTLTLGTSSSVTISPAAPAKLVWAAQPPGSVTVGVPFGATLDVVDQFGNAEPSYTQTVTLALDLNGNADAADLGGTVSIAAQGGIVTFSDAIINAIGSPFTLLPTSADGLTAPASGAISVIAPQLVVTTQPATNVTAGSAFSIVVTAETSTGAVDTNFTSSIGLSIASGPTGGSLGGTLSATASAGVATFNNLLLDTAGAYFLQATGGNATSVNTRQITVVASSVVASLVIEQQPPSSVQAGGTFGFEVGGIDQFGNPTGLTGSVTVAILNNPDNSTLGGTLTVNASGGVAKFTDLTLNKVGTGYTLQASASPAASATTNAIDVTEAPASQLVIPTADEPPLSVDEGATFSLTVDVEDQFGNLIPDYQGSVTISQPSVIAGTTTATVVNGVATFDNDLQINTPGTYQLVATSGTLHSATSTAITVNSSQQPAKLAWATEPESQVTQGSGFGAVIDVEDQFGNIENAFDGSVSIALDANPGSATLGGNVTVTAAAGVATFAGLTINVADSGYTLMASTSSTSGPINSPASSAINVSAIPATSLEITAEPPSSNPDTQTFGLTVDVLDSLNQPDPDYNGPVTVSIATPSGSTALTGTTTVNAVAGIATFTGLGLTQLGNFTLQVSTTGLKSVTTSTITITPGAASQLVVVSAGSSLTGVTAGDAFNVEVEAEDPYGYQATGFSGTLSAAMAANSQGAALSGSPMAIASQGIANFTGLIVDRAGSGFAISVTDTNPGDGVSGITTPAFSVTPNTPTTLVYASPPPTRATAGVPFSLTVGVADSYGNVVPSYTGNVSIAILTKPAAGPLNGILTEPLTSGLAVFSNLTLDTVASNYTLQATSGGVSSVSSFPIAVTAGSPAQLVVTAQPPSNVSAGGQFGVAVSAEDAYGNLTGGFTGTVTLSLRGPSGPVPLNGGPLSTLATGGIASFAPDLAIDTAGSGFTIQASSPGLATGSSIPITVTGLSPTHLAVVSQPPPTLATGGSFGFVVAAEDQYGNINGGFNGTIVISLPAGSGASLGGTTQLTAAGGVASFQGLTLANLAGPVQIAVNSTGLASTQTAAIAPIVPTGGPNSTSSTPLVTMTTIQVITNKKHQVTEILVTFSGALNPGEAGTTSEYKLITAGKRNSFTVKNAKPVAIGSAVYNAANDTVALTPAKKLVIKKPTQFTVMGTGTSGLEDSLGRLIDGNHDGQAGGNAVAIFTKKGKGVGVQTLAVPAGVVDVLFETGDPVRTRRFRH
jgi:streptogramin lyase